MNYRILIEDSLRILILEYYIMNNLIKEDMSPKIIIIIII